MGASQSSCLAPRTSSLPRHPASKIESAATIRHDLRDAFEKAELRVEHLHPLLNFIDQAIKTLEGAGTSQIDAVQSEKSDIADGTLNLAQSLVQHVAEECKTAQEQAVGTDTKNLFFTEAFGSAMTQAFGQILGKLGTLHWSVCVLSLVGYFVTQKQLVADNKDAMLDILKRMHSLAKNVVQLIPQFSRPGGDVMLKKAVYEVATGVIACCSTDRSHRLYSYFFSSVDQGTLSEIGRKVTQINEEITRNLLIEIVDRLPPAYKPSNISLPKHLVGMEKQVEEVIGKIGFRGNSPAHGIVLYGMGGVGKTTLMDAVCQNMRASGKESAIIIRSEVGETPKIPKLQGMILEQLTGRTWKVADAKSGQEYILDELKNSKKLPLLLCIDNVLEGHHLEELLPEDLSLPMGSAILVTARNEAVKSTLGEILGDTHSSVLSHKVHLLPPQHAKELVLKLFGQKYWDASMDERLDELVATCDGHPLALKLAGKYIKSQKGKEEAWEHAIEAMRGMDHTLDGNREDQLVACLWYAVKNLDDKLRTALLDIVSFFNLSFYFEWEHVKVILGERVFEMLQERALIEIDEQKYKKRVKVHDLIVALVKKRMLPSNDQSRVRSWEDLEPLVGDLQKLGAIEGLDLMNSGGVDPIKIVDAADIVNAIQHMHSLRLLFLPRYGLECLPEYSISPRAPLRALRSGCLPCAFPSNAKELTYLELASDLDQAGASRRLQLFWEAATSLKVLLNFWSTSKALPEGTVKNWKQLEELHLDKCHSLKALPSSFGGLTKLRVLSLRYCVSLESLPQEMGNLNQLQELELVGCGDLEALPSSFDGLTALRKLDLRYTQKLHAFPQGICAGLKRLEEIDLECSGLRALPSDFCGLNFLKHLRMPSSKLEGFPEGVCGGLQSLVTLDLSATKLHALPKDMGSLTALKELLLRDCELLQVFPDGICGGLRSLEHLDLSRTKLTVLPADLGCLTAIRVLRVGRCETLDAFKGAGFKSSLEVLDLSECGDVNKLPFDLKEFASLKELFLFPSSEHQNLMPLDNQCNLKMEDFPDVRNKVRQDMVDLEESERRKKAVELLRNAKLIGCDELAVIQPGALNGKVLGLLFAKPGETYYSDEVKKICEEVAKDAEGKPVQCLLVVDPCAEGGDKAWRAYMPGGWLGVSTWDPETRAALSMAYGSNAIEDAQGSSFVFIDVMEEGGHMQWDAFGTEAYPFGDVRMKDRPDDELSLLVEINCVLNHVKSLEDGVAKTVEEKRVALFFSSLVQQENGSGLKWDLLKHICESLSEDSAIRIVWIPAPYDGDWIPKILWPTPWCIYYARGADIMRSVKKLWRQFGFGWHDKQVDYTQRIVMFDREKQTIHRDFGHVLLQHGVDAAFTMDSASLQLQEEKDWLAPFDNAQSSLGVVLHGCERLLAPKQTQVDISEIQGRPIGLLFLPSYDRNFAESYTYAPFTRWLSNLKATYERMKENDEKFEIIYVTERAHSSKAFEQAYQGMPWLALSLADALRQRIKWCVARERMRQLLDEDPLKKKWFQLLSCLPYETLQHNYWYRGAQLLLFGADGEPSGGSDPLRCEGFCSWGRHLPRFADFLQLPPSLQHSSHDRHVLIPLNRFARCDICGKDGIGFYTCIECDFDVCIEKCWKT